MINIGYRVNSLRDFEIFFRKFWDFFSKNFHSGNLLNIWQKFWDFFQKFWNFLPRNFEIFYQKILRFFSENYETFTKKFWVWKLIEFWNFFKKKFEIFLENFEIFYEKILRFVKDFESGNLLETYAQKFWDFLPWKFEIFFKKISVWRLIEYMAKILSLETYWIYVKNFESGNLLDIWQKF